MSAGKKVVPVTIKRAGGAVAAGSALSAGAKIPTYIPRAGDIIHVNFSPAAGREMIEKHYALVVSEYEFNKASGLVWLCPISQGIGIGGMEGQGLSVTLMGTGLRTQGRVLVYQLRSLDYRARSATCAETAPESIMEEVRDGIAAIARIV